MSNTQLDIYEEVNAVRVRIISNGKTYTGTEPVEPENERGVAHNKLAARILKEIKAYEG